ncbi:interleukin-8-like [Heterodontus francisci]|uniref:interleukin-8-like n=1 Tax=Heterodontus francisci TaxID=7792 RepID=UPI00355AE1B3
MNGKVTVTIVALFVLYASSTQGTSVIRTIEHPRCQCINKSSNFISPKLMRDIDIFPSSPHCPNVEVIVTLKDKSKKVCLDPNAIWVKKLIDKVLQEN